MTTPAPAYWTCGHPHAKHCKDKIGRAVSGLFFVLCAQAGSDWEQHLDVDPNEPVGGVCNSCGFAYSDSAIAPAHRLRGAFVPISAERAEAWLSAGGESLAPGEAARLRALRAEALAMIRAAEADARARGVREFSKRGHMTKTLSLEKPAAPAAPAPAGRGPMDTAARVALFEEIMLANIATQAYIVQALATDMRYACEGDKGDLRDREWLVYPTKLTDADAWRLHDILFT